MLDIKVAGAHSSGPVTIYPQVYHVHPGETLTQDMRVCLTTGAAFTISNIKFTGNYSNWAKVNEEFPIEVAQAGRGASGMDIPLTVTVPSNFSGRYAIIQTVVDLQTAGANISAPAGVPVFAKESFGAHQNLTDCNYVSELQTGISYGIIVLISVGAALVALAYYAYKRSKKNSKENKASLITKIFSIAFVIIGSLLILVGLFLLVVQKIL